MATRKDLEAFLAERQISQGHLRVIRLRLDGVASQPEGKINEATVKLIFEGLPDLWPAFSAFLVRAPAST